MTINTHVGQLWGGHVANMVLMLPQGYIYRDSALKAPRSYTTRPSNAPKQRGTHKATIQRKLCLYREGFSKHRSKPLVTGVFTKHASKELREAPVSRATNMPPAAFTLLT